MRSVVRMISAVATVLCVGVVWGQNYPVKPIRMVTTAIGSGTDVVTRLIAGGLGDSLGKQVIVDNQAAFIITAQTVSKAPPDGYTLLVSADVLWLLPFLQDKLGYDPIKDFSSITLAASAPTVLTVTPTLPVKSVKDLIALAKERPGELNYASSGTGTASHLAGELFNTMAGVKIVRILYKSGADVLSDFLTGRVQMMFAPIALVMPQIKSGKLKALAVTSGKPSALLPELPTVAASLPGYELSTAYGVFAPAKTSETVVNLLSREIGRVINKPEVKEKFLSAALEPVGSSPEVLVAFRETEMATMGKVIKDAGIRNE